MEETQPQPTFATEEEGRAIAALKNHPGFVTLLRLLEVYKNNTEEAMAVAVNGEQALKLLRFWQFQRAMLETFIIGPEKIFQELENQKALAAMERDPSSYSGQNYFAGTQAQGPAGAIPPRIPGRR